MDDGSKYNLVIRFNKNKKKLEITTDTIDLSTIQKYVGSANLLRYPLFVLGKYSHKNNELYHDVSPFLKNHYHLYLLCYVRGPS